MSNFKCKDCEHFQQGKNNVKTFWYGTCKAKSIYDEKSTLTDVKKGPKPRLVIVDAEGIETNCTDGIRKK